MTRRNITHLLGDKQVEPCPPSPGYPNSQTPSSPDFSTSTSEDKDAIYNVAGQQPQSTQCTLSPYLRRRVVVGTNRYYLEYLYLFDDGPSPQTDVFEVKMLAFLALTLQVGQNSYRQTV